MGGDYKGGTEDHEDHRAWISEGLGCSLNTETKTPV